MTPLTFTVVTLAGALVALAMLLGLVLLVRRRERLADLVQALFRRPAKPGQPPGPRHYYKHYWS
jgi:hypothetical protein